MMMMISFLLICCYLFTKTASSSSSDTTTLTYRQCFETLFNLTQSCSNHNYFYATNIGVASNNNFISEFNEYLMKILLRAIYTNRRFIYLQTNRTWKYNCEEGKGWACYFSFTPCLDGTVTRADMDMSRLPSNDYITDPGNAYMDREDMNNYHFNAVFVYFRTIEIDRFYQGQALLAPNICDQFPESMIPSITADGLAGPIAKHLFRLNNKTISIINMMNRRYEHLQNKTFVSVLLDNQSNIIDPVALPKASNATWISSQILHITTIITSKKIHVRNIFMGKLDTSISFLYFVVM